jgi:tetratricopeptide (TPR) repeat protein
MSSTIENRLNNATQALATGQHGSALHEAEIALAELEQASCNIETRVKAYELSCQAAMGLANYTVAAEYAQHALELLTSMDEPKRMHACRMELAVCSLHQGDLRQAQYLVVEILSKAQQHSWHDLEARCQLYLGTLAWQEGRVDQAVELLEQTLPLLEQQDLAYYAAQASASLGVALTLAERESEAEACFKTALDYHQQHRDDTQAIRCLNNLAGLAFRRQDWNRAREYLLDCVKFMSESGNKIDLATAWQNLGLVEMHQGDWQLANKYLHRALQLAQEVENRRVEADAFLKLAILSLAKGDPVGAANFGALARNRFEGLTGGAATTLYWFLALIELANGRDESASRLWAARAPWPGDQDLGFVKELLQRILADQYVNAVELPRSPQDLGHKWLGELDEKTHEST